MKDENSVRDYNVTEGSVIHLVPQYEMLEFSRVHGIKMIQDDPSTSNREKKVDPSTSSRELQVDPRTSSRELKADPRTSSGEQKVDPSTSSRELKADPRTSSRELEALPSEMNSPKMWITVKRLNDNTYNCNEIVFDIHQNEKVKRIKEHLHKMTGIPPQRQRLISNHGKLSTSDTDISFIIFNVDNFVVILHKIVG